MKSYFWQEMEWYSLPRKWNDILDRKWNDILDRKWNDEPCDQLNCALCHFPVRMNLSMRGLCISETKEILNFMINVNCVKSNSLVWILRCMWVVFLFLDTMDLTARLPLSKINKRKWELCKIQILVVDGRILWSVLLPSTTGQPVFGITFTRFSLCVWHLRRM